MSIKTTTSEGTTNSCGCCGCLFTIIFGIILISLLAGNFKVNDKIWNLDLLPPGLHSSPNVEQVEPKSEQKPKVVEKKTPEISEPSGVTGRKAW